MRRICFRYARFLRQTRIIRASHAVSRQFVSPWRTLAFRSVGYVSVASRSCDECNRESHRAVAIAQELALAKPNEAFRCYRDQGTVARNREKSRQRRRNAARQIKSSPRYRTDRVTIADDHSWWHSRINDCRNRECITKSRNDHVFNISLQ